mgnify:FL=1
MCFCKYKLIFASVKTEKITSARNERIRQVLELQEKSRTRRALGLFVVEGRRELEHCLEAGYEIDSVFWCPEILPELPQELIGGDVPVSELTAELYGRIAYRGGTEGLVARVKARPHTLEDLTLKDNPLIVVLESVEKPGNLGAVFRSADAAGADAVIICDPLTDLYNPNLIRSSIGGVFTVQSAVCDSASAISWLKARGMKILTAQLQDSSWYYDVDMKGGTAIVIGTEATGLTEQWREAADAHIRIPMLGALDSLNASVSAAILLFEAVRQRNS